MSIVLIWLNSIHKQNADLLNRILWKALAPGKLQRAENSAGAVRNYILSMTQKRFRIYYTTCCRTLTFQMEMNHEVTQCKAVILLLI